MNDERYEAEVQQINNYPIGCILIDRRQAEGRVWRAPVIPEGWVRFSDRYYKGPIIELRWSDEDVWKAYKPADDRPAETQLAEIQAEWVATKAEFNLQYDAEFRIR